MKIYSDNYLDNNFYRRVQRFKSNIGLIKTRLLRFMNVSHDQEHISYITNIVEKINNYATQCAEITEKLFWANFLFKSNMLRLMEYPVHFWKVFNENFTTREMDVSISNCLNGENLAKYKFSPYDFEQTVWVPYHFEYSSVWIVEDCQGNRFVVFASLTDFKYYCVNLSFVNNESEL